MTKQQEKCMCKCHGEIVMGKKINTDSGNCVDCALSHITPSPHQEGWEEKLNIALKGSALARPAVIKVFREALLSTRSADIEAFRGMIGETEWDKPAEERNKFRAELRQKLQEYEKEGEV